MLLSGTTGKHLIRHMLANPTTDSPLQIARTLDLLALSSSAQNRHTNIDGSQSAEDPLLTICEKVIATLPSEVAAAKKGNKNVLNKIVGVVMRESRGRADGKRVREVVERLVYNES